MIQTHSRREFATECRNLLVRTALEAAESMPTAKRIMIHHAIGQMFPTGSSEHQQAMATARALGEAEKLQMELVRLLNNP